MLQWWNARMARRPRWMNALMLFCAFMAFVYVPWDFVVKPAAVDVEAWFGILLRGWWAKLTEPLHWAIYAAGAYGFWRMRSWMWPWAAVYAAQLAIGMLVWNVVYVGGVRGWLGGLVSLVPFGALTAALWVARDRFHAARDPLGTRYGGWALVTGASAGIGAAFARALARDGMPCVLTARRADRLETLADEIRRSHGVETRVVAADLATAEGVEAVVAAVADLDLGVVVNNAGFGYAGRFDKQTLDRLVDMVELNCVAVLRLAHRLLPGLATRGRGAMIITGSVAGHQPLARHGVYAATKAFDLLLGEALWAEYRDSGVDVLVLEPGATESEFVAVAGEVRERGEPAADVVAAAFDALGHQPSVVSGWLNWLRANAARFLPRSIAALVAEQVILRQTPPERR